MKDGGLLTNFPVQPSRRFSYSSHGSRSPAAAISVSSSLYASSTQRPPIDPTLRELGHRPMSLKRAFNLPAYILPPQRDISEAELQFLASQGALSIPDDELRDQLLRDFIWYSYPYMPVICLEDFLQGLEGGDQHQISLSLFQAVMFAGSSFVDELYLQQAGFESRRSARAYFYKKVKLLYDFDWESDRITLMQTMLLHTYWYTAESDQKDPWHWAGVCMSLGVTLGLNERATYKHEDLKTRKLWRRLWWCCYLRDRALAISARRPMRFRDDQVHISMLQLDDFDLNTPETGITTIKIAFSVTSHDCRLALARMCMENIKLASILGRILEKFYQLQGFSGSTKGPRMLYCPKTSDVDPQEAKTLETELERWASLLPSTCRIQQEENLRTPTEELLHLHQATLKLGYLLVTEAFHRPLSISRGETTLSTDLLQRRSRPIVKECAISTAEVVKSLRERDLFRFLPPGAGTCIGVAVASFLAEIKSSGKSLSALPGQHFQQCIRGLWSLRETWPIADAVCQIVGHMMRAKDVETARVVALQAQPFPMEDAPDGSRESGMARSAGTAIVEPPNIEVHGFESEVLQEDGIGLGIEAAARTSNSSAFGLLDVDDVWSLSNQAPWTLTQFGLYEDLQHCGGDIFLPSATQRRMVDDHTGYGSVADAGPFSMLY
ncbi:hypothetical protein H2200_012306 [Cladophialophora chaetospira]|uniref:Xylanolytic transcriptional activator regulatory domain-containing protein n=1 Tax=Cladophialophora chaetospira TaxID=386627 RepID=A0AA38WXK0_9EURO|nr:hypothetical protein H2200_012306 [Cladophialophora chaetospira]